MALTNNQDAMETGVRNRISGRHFPGGVMAPDDLESKRGPADGGTDLGRRGTRLHIGCQPHGDLGLDSRSDQFLQADFGSVRYGAIVDRRPERTVQAQLTPDVLIGEAELETDSCRAVAAPGVEKCHSCAEPGASLGSKRSYSRPAAFIAR